MRVMALEQARATILRRQELAMGKLPPGLERRLQEVFGPVSVEQAVERILADVRSRGDEALFYYEEVLDGAKLTSLEVSPQEMAQAQKGVDEGLASALRLAAERIRSFHQAARDKLGLEFSLGEVGQVVRPLERVGLYVPGGIASYPSTVLMLAIPAQVAGVGEVVVVTPPRPDGQVPAPVLMAAEMAGVGRVFKVGGAQAVAALAYGTASVPRMDKICGPGNIFVQMAKKKVYGQVGIDGLYGPTETLIVADEGASPSLCAADLLAQAEHDPMASAILITMSPELAQRVAREVERQLETLERGDIARDAIEAQGGIVVAPSLEAALEAANEYAPEHLCLLVKGASSYLSQIRHAGGVFLGEASAEALGDYVAGPSHVMPTGGWARFASPIGVTTFLRTMAVVSSDQGLPSALVRAAAALARAEGLPAHARAAEMRLGR